MENWHQNSMSARQFERQFYLVYFSALGLPFLAPELLAATPELILTKGLISATAQGVVNGPSQINVMGVAADAFLPFGSAAIVNGVAGYRPFAESNQLTYLGFNKSLEQSMIDFSASFVVGGIGARLGTGLPSVSGTFQKNVVEVSTGVPTSFAQEIGNMLINQKVSTQNK